MDGDDVVCVGVGWERCVVSLEKRGEEGEKMTTEKI